MLWRNNGSFYIPHDFFDNRRPIVTKVFLGKRQVFFNTATVQANFLLPRTQARSSGFAIESHRSDFVTLHQRLTFPWFIAPYSLLFAVEFSTKHLRRLWTRQNRVLSVSFNRRLRLLDFWPADHHAISFAQITNGGAQNCHFKLRDIS